MLILQAIDVWMGVCTAFVFAALVEFTFVNYMWRKSCQVRVDHHSQHGVKGDHNQRKPKNSSTFFTCLDKQGDIELDMVSYICHKNVDIKHQTSVVLGHNLSYFD